MPTTITGTTLTTTAVTGSNITSATGENLVLKRAGVDSLTISTSGVGIKVSSPGTNTLDVSTAGWGVKLPTSNANSDSNTLDCYAEGTWTPTLTGFTGGPTITANYTRIGRIVWITAKIAPTSGASWNTGAINTTYFSLPVGMNVASDSSGGGGQVWIQSTGASSGVAFVHSSNNAVYLPAGTIASANTLTVNLSVFYITA